MEETKGKRSENSATESKELKLATEQTATQIYDSSFVPAPPAPPIESPKIETKNSEPLLEQENKVILETINPEAAIAFETRKKDRFPLFLILGLILVVGIWGFVGYIYFDNQKLKKEKELLKTSASFSPTPTPTPSFSPDWVKIKNGNVVLEKPNSEPEIIVDKTKYSSTGITGFSKVSVSPDNSRICFEALPPATEPALYVAKIDGGGVVEVSPNRYKCLWTPDSKSILYLNLSPSEKKAVDIYYFGLEEGVEKNLTLSVSEETGTKRFDIVGLSADESKVICKYEDLSLKEKKEGQCEIDLKSLEVSLID